MEKRPGPWDSRQPPTPRARRRLIGPLAALALGVVIVLGLLRLYPERRLTSEDLGRLAQSVIVLGVLGAGGWRLRTLGARTVFRYAALWILLGGALFAGVVFWPDVRSAGGRLAAALAPDRPQTAEIGAVRIGRDADGGFYVRGLIDGTPVRFLIDTGASEVVLSPDDARRLGLDPGQLRYSRGFASANGTGAAAPIRARDIDVGGLRFRSVPMVVNRAPMATSLLGQTFLARLKSARIEGDDMILTAP